MPLKLTAGISKKLGLPGYSSVGAICHVEMELDSGLIEEALEVFRAQVRRIYAQCAESVDEELARHQAPRNPARPASEECAEHCAIANRHCLPDEHADGYAPNVLAAHPGAEGAEFSGGGRVFRGPICCKLKPRPSGYMKSHPVKDQQAVRQWADRHDCCQVCGIDEHKARCVQVTGLQTHHIVKAGRSDEPCNLLRVCERCHRIIEGESVPDGNGGYWPQLTLAHVLHCKQEQDPREFNSDRLTILWRNRQRTRDFDPLPPPEPLPDAYVAERMQWLSG